MAEYKKKKIVDKEVQTNGFENRGEDFQDSVTKRGEIYDMIRELTEEATEKAFDEKGVEKIEKYAGVYATGKSYGAGVQKGKYEVRLSSNVKPIIQKQTIYGTKRMETEITSDFDADNELLTVHYDGTEKAIFRGHSDNETPQGYMINDKITVSTKDEKNLKKELKDFFENCAKKEVSYLMKTKLGIDDRMETSLAGSVVENTNINKMGINDLLNSSPEEIANFFENKLQESKEGGMKNIDPEGEEVKGPEDFHPQDVIDANTQGNLLFDDEESELEDDEETLNESDLIKYAKSVKRKNEKLKEFQSLNESEESEENIEEMTTSAVVAPTGTAGGYLTPHAFKDTNYAKNKKKRPSIKKSKNEGDSFWTTVDIDDIKDTHPLGLPGVKPGSKEELKAATSGGAATTKFIKKLQEGRTHDVSKRKFFNEAQNEEAGLNKRYLVTNKLSNDELKNKWSKLSNFVSESTINKEALSEEDMEILENCGCMDADDKMYTQFKGNVVSREEAEAMMNAEFEEENSDIEDMANMENLVDVQKPGSFVILKVSETDLMNENKKFVFDHNTKNYVLHPGLDQANIVSENKEKVFDIKTRTFVPNPKYRK